MIDDTLLLFKNYWTIDRRGESRRTRLAQLIIYGVSFILAVALSAAIGAGAGSFITNPEMPLRIRLGTVPGLLLTVVLVATVMTGVNQALRALYLANDMELLFSAHIRTESVLTAKLLSRLPGTILITLILTIPALIAFGVTAGLGFGFYIAGTITLLLAPLFGLAAGALLAMLVVRVLPAKRVSEYMGAASILLGVLLAIGFQLPRLFFSAEDRPVNPQTVEALNALVDNIQNMPVPTMWAGHALVDLAQGRIVQSLGGLSIYFLLTAGFFFLVVLLANKLYLNSWLRMQGSGVTRGGYTEEKGLFGSGSVEASIAVKDWLLRLRDARQLAGFVSGLIFALFFGFLLLRPGSQEGLLNAAQNGSGTGTFLDVLFSRGVVISGAILYAGWITFNRAGITSLSMEGASLYLLKAAPVDPRTIFRSKVMGIVLPYTVICLLLLLLAWVVLRFNLVWVPYAWLCLALIGYGMLTISTSYGFQYPKLDWDDPRRMMTQRASLLNLVTGALFGFVALVVAALPFLLSAFFPQYALLLVLVGLLLLAGMAWLVERWSARRVIRAWPALGVQ